MPDDRFVFEASCPICYNTTPWLFPITETGDKLVVCDQCGESYVIRISLKPHVDAIFKLTEVTELQND